MTLPELAIRRPVTTLMLLVSLVALGGVALVRLPLAFMPKIEEPELFVRFPYPSASPEQIEQMILRPAEEALASVRGLSEMWSRADQDDGVVRLEFDWNTDLHLARVEVWEKLDRIRRDLPDDLGDITVSEGWNTRETDSPILEARISSELDLGESYDLLERRLVRPLQRVPGVAQVRLDGIEPREVRVNLRLVDLELHNIDVRDVARILRSSNFNQSLGEVEEGEVRYTLRTLGTFDSIDQIKELPIRGDGLRLQDIADVTYREPDLEFGRHLDGHFAVGLTVSAEAKANVVEVCKALEQRIAEMQADSSLEGIKFLVWFSQGDEIENTLGELFYTGVFGAILASLVLWVFLRRLSTTLVSVLCIPFALVVTCGIIWAQGGTLNTLTLLGLIVGVGMLVDNAVVVMENIFRHQERGEGRREAARKGSREVSVAVMAATLTSVIVFLPIIFDKPSRLSLRLREIGLTVCLTLLASLFVSQTLIPLATSWAIRARQRPRERWLVWLEDRYVSLMRFNLRRRWLTPVILLCIAAVSTYPFSQMEISFDRDRAELYAQIHYRFTEPTTLEKTEQLISRMEKILQPHREELLAKSFYSYWRHGFAMTRVYLQDGKATPDNLARAREKLREILPEVPGVRIEVNEDRRSWRHDSGKRVAFEILGEDAEVLAELAEEAKRRLATIEGLAPPGSSDRRGQQELHVEIDRELVSRYGIVPSEFANSVGLSFRGRRLPRYRTPDGEREMWLTLEEQETESVSQLRNLPLWSETGEKLSLASMANLVERRGPNRIERENRLKSVWVYAEYDEGQREDYLPAVRRAMADMEFPYGYSWSFGDRQERRRQQNLDFLVNLLLALLLIFAVMASLFESVGQAIALMISLPFALAGAVWTLFLFGLDFDYPAAVGLLLLIGIVVNNGIVMIEHINTYRRRGMRRTRAMLRGGRERLRPILMTAVTTLIGLVPMIIKKPALGGVYYYSMALVIMGGIALSTFLTSVLLPATVTLVEDGFALAARPFRGRRPDRSR